MYVINRNNKVKSKFNPDMAVDEETRKLVEELAEAEKELKSKFKK